MKKKCFKINLFLLILISLSSNCFAGFKYISIPGGSNATGTGLAASTSGSKSLVARYFNYKISEIIPIGSHSALVGDMTSNRIINLDVSSGEENEVWQLNNAPDHIQYDADNGFIYASLSSSPYIARINTTTDEIEYLLVVKGGIEPVKDIVLGEAGELYVYHADDSSVSITIVDAINWEITGSPQTSFECANEDSGKCGTFGRPTYDDPYIVYNPYESMLYVSSQGVSPPSTARLSYDAESQEFTMEEQIRYVGGNDIAISSDGAYLAFFALTIHDIDPTSLEVELGEWDTTSFAYSGDFFVEGDSLIAANSTEIEEFTISTHAKINTWDLYSDVTYIGSESGCEYRNIKLLRYTPSGDNAFLLSECGFFNDGAEITMFNRSIDSSIASSNKDSSGGGSTSLLFLGFISIFTLIKRRK